LNQISDPLGIPLDSYFKIDALVLLRHELECLCVVFLRAQQGHREVVLASATMRRRRMVAIESGM